MTTLIPSPMRQTSPRIAGAVLPPAANGVASTLAAALLAAAVLAAALATPYALAGQEGIPPGTTPAAVQLPTLEGDTIDLASFVGVKPVLVEFWATWCTVCRALEPRMIAAHERFGDRVEFLVVAVGVAQDPASIARHLQRHPQPGTVLWDGRGAAVRAFDAPGTGVVFILNRAGAVVYSGTGADQDLESALDDALDDAPNDAP